MCGSLQRLRQGRTVTKRAEEREREREREREKEKRRQNESKMSRGHSSVRNESWLSSQFKFKKTKRGLERLAPSARADMTSPGANENSGPIRDCCLHWKQFWKIFLRPRRNNEEKKPAVGSTLLGKDAADKKKEGTMTSPRTNERSSWPGRASGDRVELRQSPAVGNRGENPALVWPVCSANGATPSSVGRPARLLFGCTPRAFRSPSLVPQRPHSSAPFHSIQSLQWLGKSWISIKKKTGLTRLSPVKLDHGIPSFTEFYRVSLKNKAKLGKN